MPFFFVSNAIDEGIYPSSVRLVEAESEVTVAQHMIDFSGDWEGFN